MILLDTNYLILALVDGSEEAARILAWADAGERFCTTAVVWYEFCCGPVDRAQQAAIRGLLDEILPFDETQAELTARLFNAAGRPRRLRVDAMIAAAAIARGAPLATRNHADFTPFVAQGLRLLGAS